MPEYYKCQEVKNYEGMEFLRILFPDCKPDEMNFVLFSTDGVHGRRVTIEDIESPPVEDDDEEDDEPEFITFLVVHPRTVSLSYGNAIPETPEDFEFLKNLRQRSWDVVKEIGR